MRTVGDSYQLQPGEGPDRVTLEVPFVFTNKTGRPLSLVHCRHDVPRLERATPDGWVRLFSGPELLCLQVRTFEPGQTTADTARFVWRTNSAPADRFQPGEYRLVWANLWGDYSDFDNETGTWGTRVDSRLLESNTFLVSAGGS